MPYTSNNFVVENTRGQVGLPHWGVGFLVAIGIHISVVVMALSSGAGFSLAPEGGGGTGGSGGLTVMMGSAINDCPPAVEEVAAPPSPSEPMVEPPKIKQSPKLKVKKVPSKKPKPKVKPKISKPKPVQRNTSVATNQNAFSKTNQLQAAGQGAGQENRKAGGGGVSGTGLPVGQSVGAGTSKGFGVDTAMKSYKRAVFRLLNRKKQYPRAAQRLGQQGVVRVKIVISKAGKLLDSKIIKSSSYPSLNREVIRLVRKRIRSYPPIPSKLNRATQEFTFNLPFILE